MMNFSANDSINFKKLEMEGDVDSVPLDVTAISVALAFVMALTLFGNSVVLLSFYAQPSLRKVIYLPIISLSLADLLCAVTAMPLYIVKKNTSKQIDERLVCDLYRFSYFFTEYASIMSLVAISVERFLKIYNPLKYRNFISRRVMVTALIVCWLEALMVSLMPFYWRSNQGENCTNSPTASWSLMVITVNVFIPFLIMLSCHCYIYLKSLQEFQSNENTKLNRADHVTMKIIQAANWKMERKATISFTVVIGVFAVCWGPSTLYYFLRNLCPECFSASYKPIKDIIGTTMKLLTFCNSLMNPIIYFWLNNDFRKAFLRVLKREWTTTRSRSGTINSLSEFIGARLQGCRPSNAGE